MSFSDPKGVWTQPCIQCKSDMWLPQTLYEAAMHGREKITFYCPYGHGQVFSKGENEADRMRRERDRAHQALAQKNDEIASLYKQLDCERAMLRAAVERERNLKATAVRAKKRTAAGVCPCCNRTFRQMALHMKKQHPEFKAQEIA